MKYKLSPNPNQIILTHDDESGTAYAKDTKGWKKYIEWLADGNIAEPVITEEEQLELDKNWHKEPRRKDYEKAGLTFNYWNEINIENDQEKIDKFRTDREVIKQKIKKKI